ncbi:unannotated protein [freshwater metagenome]|uniref:Unannotated protein n=1 Tax=freshwater metagenome TaxID=449393 RepID=A0A6J6WET8_9ZZZZ
MLPKICNPRESLSSAAAPSRVCEVRRIASNFDSMALRSRSAARSLSINSLSVAFAPSSAFLAFSNCESKPSSPESAVDISDS